MRIKYIYFLIILSKLKIEQKNYTKNISELINV